MSYEELIFRDNRRNFFKKAMKYIEERTPLDLLYRDEITFIHNELMKGDFYL